MPVSVTFTSDTTVYADGEQVNVTEGVTYQFSCTTSKPVYPSRTFSWFLDGNSVLTEDNDVTVDCVAEEYQSQYTLNNVEFSNHHSKRLTCRASSDNTQVAVVSSGIILNVQGRNL